MAYSEQYYPKAVDLKTAVSRLCSTFVDLEFDAVHALNYDYRVFLDEQELQRVKDLADNYGEATEVCRLYLDEDISLECLLYEFLKLNLQSFIRDLAEFLPQNLKDRFIQPSIGDETDSE